MATLDCTLSINVARTDVAFLEATIPHLTTRAHFAHRVLVMDTRPPSSDFRSRPHAGSVEQLIDVCETLRSRGCVDELVEVDYSEERLRTRYRPRFRRAVDATHDFHGAPVHGYMFALDSAPTRYVVHADSDMMLHQAHAAPSWVERGIELMRRHADLFCVLPRSGPPRADGRLFQPDAFVRDARGFCRFTTFTSRIFLVDTRRMEQLYPLDPRWPRQAPCGWRRRARLLANRWRGRSTLPAWEMMVTARMAELGWWRADLEASTAWSLHPLDRSSRFFARLPSIIERVERGEYPSAQAGHYDLQLESWI